MNICNARHHLSYKLNFAKWKYSYRFLFVRIFWGEIATHDVVWIRAYSGSVPSHALTKQVPWEFLNFSMSRLQAVFEFKLWCSTPPPPRYLWSSFPLTSEIQLRCLSHYMCIFVFMPGCLWSSHTHSFMPMFRCLLLSFICTFVLQLLNFWSHICFYVYV